MIVLGIYKGAARMDDALNIGFIDCLKDLLRL